MFLLLLSRQDLVLFSSHSFCSRGYKPLCNHHGSWTARWLCLEQCCLVALSEATTEDDWKSKLWPFWEELQIPESFMSTDSCGLGFVVPLRWQNPIIELEWSGRCKWSVRCFSEILHDVKILYKEWSAYPQCPVAVHLVCDCKQSVALPVTPLAALQTLPGQPMSKQSEGQWRTQHFSSGTY